MSATDRNPQGKVRRAALLVLLLAGLTVGASARDLYVDRSHPQASDSNPGSEALPWLTFRSAAAKAVAGDTVYIKKGTYNERQTISIANSGTAAAPITFRNYGSDAVIIDGTGMPSGSKLIRWAYPGVSYIILSGLEIRNVPDAGIWVEGSHNNLRDLKVHDTGSTGILCRRGSYNTYSRLQIYNTGWNGIDLEDSEYSTIEWCDIHDNPKHHAVNIFPAPGESPFYGQMRGIVVRHNKLYRSNKGIYLRYVTDIEISNNLIANNQEWGIYFHYESGRSTSYTANAKIYNNTIVNNAWEGIYDENASSLTIKNNIFCNAKEREVYFGPATGHVLDYNLYDPGTGNPVSLGGTSYSLASLRSAKGFEIHGVAGSCAFTGASAGNYTITSGSKAINVGANLSSIGLVDDLAGNARPQGGAYDIGAYEYGSGSLPSAPRVPVNLRIVR